MVLDAITRKLPWPAQRSNHCLPIVLALELDLGFRATIHNGAECKWPPCLWQWYVSPSLCQTQLEVYVYD